MGKEWALMVTVLLHTAAPPGWCPLSMRGYRLSPLGLHSKGVLHGSYKNPKPGCCSLSPWVQVESCGLLGCRMGGDARFISMQPPALLWCLSVLSPFLRAFLLSGRPVCSGGCIGLWSTTVHVNKELSTPARGFVC